MYGSPYTIDLNLFVPSTLLKCLYSKVSNYFTKAIAKKILVCDIWTLQYIPLPENSIVTPLLTHGSMQPPSITIISSKDKDDMELVKQLRSDPPSLTMFAGMMRMRAKVLTVQDANEKILRDEEQRIHLQKATAKEPSVRNEVTELRAFMLE